MVTEEPPSGHDPQFGQGKGRHQRGARKLHAEPLTASWRLDTSTHRLAPEEVEAVAKPKRRNIFSYGWWVYPVPVLVIVTILVVINTTQHGAQNNGIGAPATTTPVATEQQAVPVDPGSGTAALPPGPQLPGSGAGTWHMVPGNGPVVGTGKQVYRYQVAVEDGVDSSVYGGDDAFAAVVDATLSDPRSWIGAGTVSVQRVGASYPNPDFVVSLTTSNTDHRPDLCGNDIPFEVSCWAAGVHRIIINLARWVRGALAFNGDLGLYRQYAINHEVGVVLGNGNIGCATNGGLAPVMMQQTFGVSDDYVHDLDQVSRTTRDAVPRDDKVCRPNAWPYPQGPANAADNPPS